MILLKTAMWVSVPPPEIPSGESRIHKLLTVKAKLHMRTHQGQGDGLVGKCLLHKCGNLRLDHQHPRKAFSVVVCTCHAVVRRRRQEGSWNSWPASQILKLHVRVQKIRYRMIDKTPALWPLHRHSIPSPPLHTHTGIYTNHHHHPTDTHRNMFTYKQHLHTHKYTHSQQSC